MSITWTGPARAALTMVVGVGLVVLAVQVPGTVALAGRGTTPADGPTPQLVPVQSTTLSCPGPETEGLPGTPAVAGSSRLLAVSAPAEALSGVTMSPGPGSLTLTATPSGAQLGRTEQRGSVVSAPMTGPTVGQVGGSGALAPGVAALQTWQHAEGDDRAFMATACPAAKADMWLLGGGGESTRRERIVLTNPGANAASADIAVYGTGGAIASANGRNVAVPPHGRVSLLLDALVGPEKTPAVHVTASGGVLTAVLADSWIDGAVGRGGDDAVPAADPSTEQVVPAVFLDGPAKLRIAVPGPDEAVVQARLLTANGPQPLPGDGVLRVPGGSVRDVDLGPLPPGAYAVQVRADHPVVAGAMVERRGSGAKTPSDFGWTTSTEPITVVSGIPLPDGAKGSLMLVSAGGPATASVVTVSPAGVVTPTSISVGPDSVTVVDLAGAAQVWVRPTAGSVRAGVSLAMTDKHGGEPLFSIVPLASLAVSATQVPVQEVRS